MNGRLTTRPLSAVAENFELVGIIEASWSPPQHVWQRLLGGRPMAGNLQRFAQHHGVPLLEVTEGHSWGSFLEQTRAEIICVSNFPFKISTDIHRSRPTLNLHPSLLPDYRGIYPLFWQFYHQETTGGWSVHLVDDGWDSGPLLAQQSFPIPFGCTTTELLDEVLQAGADLMVEALRGDLKGEPQTEAAHNAPLVSPDQRLIDWNEWSTRRVYHFLRGTFLWHDELLQLPGVRLRAVAFQETDPRARPGKMTFEKTRLYLNCRDGRIQLQVQAQTRELKRLALLAAAGLLLLHGPGILYMRVAGTCLGMKSRPGTGFG